MFERVSICGSQANSWAIDDATNQNSSLCLFAAGCYVAGDGSALQSFSTSKFNMGAGLSLPMRPNDVLRPIVSNNTVPLPYHIPGVLSAQQLIDYEDRCLEAIHIRLYWARVRRSPFKALLLELVLAGNGATLSNRVLIAIGKLAKFHGIGLIVDEIMTSGRTGGMLLLLSKPLSFRAAVTHVTLGKWCQLGIVIISKEWARKRQALYPFDALRTASTLLCAKEAAACWRCIKECQADVPIRRAKVLHKLKLTENDVWGVGLLIFGPRKWVTNHGLKHRYLPVIHADTPMDKGRSIKLDITNEQFRVDVNNTVVDTINEWITATPPPLVDNSTATPTETAADDERLRDYELVAKLVVECNEGDMKSAEEWHQWGMSEKVNRTEYIAALARLKTAGILEQQQVGRKRLRKWVVPAGILEPWRSPDLDEILEISVGN